MPTDDFAPERPINVEIVRGEIQQSLERGEIALHSMSSTAAHVRVRLPPDGAATGADLLRRYGDAVVVTLGGHAYPPPPEPVPRIAGPTANVVREDLALEVLPDATEVVGGRGRAGPSWSATAGGGHHVRHGPHADRHRPT